MTVMNTHILTAAEHTSNVKARLIGLGIGIDAVEAAEITAGRWETMGLDGALLECRQRGLALTRDDLRDYLLDVFAPLQTHSDGEPIGPEIHWPSRHVEGALAWAVANGRGTTIKPATGEHPKPEIRDIGEALQGLRSADLVTRVFSGTIFAGEFGERLRGAGATIDNLVMAIGPRLNHLLGLAMSGNAEAVEQLEGLATIDPQVIIDEPPPVIRVEDLLRELTNADKAVRVGAGVLLLKSLRAGLHIAGETPEDIENIIGPQLTELVARAVEGNAEAVEELNRLVTADQSKAFNANIATGETCENPTV